MTLNKPVDIANVANEYYISKVRKIRAQFEHESCDPLHLLEGLMPRGTKTLSFKLITLEETKLLLKSLKTSGSTGFDDLSSRTLKRCGDAIAPHLCHMVNCIIRSVPSRPRPVPGKVSTASTTSPILTKFSG